LISACGRKKSRKCGWRRDHLALAAFVKRPQAEIKSAPCVNKCIA
jgi:hypothetical protein